MGDRYIINVKCPNCRHFDDDVWFAPTCGIDTWVCPKCEMVIDLCDYTGISYDDASNREIIQHIVEDMEKEYERENK